MTTLTDFMEFDHVIHVDEDGHISRPEGVYAPDLYALSDDDGSHLPETDADLQTQARAEGWELETGWTGQHGYSGPCMHPSEFIGGALAEHILETPGYWAAVVIYEDDLENSDMWAIAYRETID